MNEKTKLSRNEKITRFIGYTKFIMKFVPGILQIICLIGFIPLLISLTPYIDGSKELETAMTPSQLTAMFMILVLCYGVMMIGKMGHR